ncbi:MAG TPA: MBL fold metallo-hydrolase [Thermoleophilaceae bacterium]|nr:MBL fold metallo-hydrolase [Thermoleophilaceae bacterium]
MNWRRLGWAGVEIEFDGETVVIDHVLDPGLLTAFLSDDREPFLHPEGGGARAALITHLHRDHADVAAIERACAPDARVLRPIADTVPSALDEVATGDAEAALAATGLEVVGCRPGERVEAGPFAITALPAADGLGSPQVSWLVEAGGRRILHAGDTMWHGFWWGSASAHGAIDVAFLPGNGVEISYPGWEPAAEVPAVMTPEQCVEAAGALRAGTLVPIHFDRTYEHPDYYRPVTDAAERISRHAERRGVGVRFAEVGEWAAA